MTLRYTLESVSAHSSAVFVPVGGVHLDPPPHAEPLPSEDATVPALVQHFEGVAVPRKQSSSAAAAALAGLAAADSAPHSSNAASDTSLAARESRVIAAVNDPAAAEIGAEIHRRWTQSREDAPSISRAAVRDSVHGPAASTAAPYRRRTEERASQSEQATPEPAADGSSEGSSVTIASAAVVTRDAGATPAFQSLPTVPFETGLRQLDSGNGMSTAMPPWAGRGLTEPSPSDRPVAQAASASDSGERGLMRTRSQRMVRFSSGSADNADSRNDMRAPDAGQDAVSGGASGVRPAAEVSRQPLQGRPGDRSEAQVR